MCMHMARTKCQLWVRAECVCKWIWCQLLELRSGVWCQLLKRNGAPPKKQLLGWTSMSEGLNAGSWSRTVGHSPCAWCWRGDKCLNLPLCWCTWSVHVYLLANSKPNSAVNRRPQVQAGVSGRQGFVLAHPGGLANMECLWYECVSEHIC